MPRLHGKVAVVTGAAAGPKAALGAIFATALAAEGAKVVLADTKDCASVAAEITATGGTAHAVLADVRDEKSIGAMIAEAERQFGRLDILVNNAAIGSNIPPIAIEEIDPALWDEFMTVNVRGTFLCVGASFLVNDDPRPSSSIWMRSIGSGKTIVLFFSAAISVSVCR